MRRKCRIWWPKQALSHDISSFYVLFGWFVSSSPESVDVVVAFASPEASLPGDHSQLLGDLQSTRESMPLSLQDETTFCALGLISADSNDNLPHPRVAMNDEQGSFNSRGNNYQNGVDTFEEKRGWHSCNYDVTDRVLKYSLPPGDCKWIMLVYDSQDDFRSDTYLIPKLHHIHWNGQVVSNCDVQVIVYEVPRFGVYHLLPSFLSCSEQMLTSSRKPNWLHELYHKKPLIDLGMTIHAINCAAAAKSVFHRNMSSKRYMKIMRPAAFLLASCSAFLYILLQLFHGILGCASHWRFSAMLSKVFPVTRRSIRIRCSQFLYWPIYLGDVNFRSRSCVEYSEKAALQRHSLWTNMIVDTLLGNAIGLALLINGEAVRHWVFVVVNNLTNYLLRSGCVWLMGVPAGFKLNTELATVFGMISLNTIQIWATLWFLLGFFFEHILQGLVMLGMVFGITTAAAFIKDMIELAALHVSALQWILSLIYSWQIQSIAFLWRLFRGQKWNPLRQRLDNFDYTVEHHIVGSLLFTSLLLLLPTTSVFYIFFSFVSASISVLCILIELIMAVVHATPYLKVLLWIVSPRRFPSGIWFKIISSRKHHLSRLNDSGYISTNSKSSGRSSNVRRDADVSFSVLVSQLHSNSSTFGDIVMPHYKFAFAGVSPSFFASAARGLLIGQRFPTTLGASFSAELPWYSIPAKEYWRLCYNSILSHGKDAQHSCC